MFVLFCFVLFCFVLFCFVLFGSEDVVVLGGAGGAVRIAERHEAVGR